VITEKQTIHILILRIPYIHTAQSRGQACNSAIFNCIPGDFKYLPPVERQASAARDVALESR
jgi:hypothetical protein